MLTILTNEIITDTMRLDTALMAQSQDIDSKISQAYKYIHTYLYARSFT